MLRAMFHEVICPSELVPIWTVVGVSVQYELPRLPPILKPPLSEDGGESGPVIVSELRSEEMSVPGEILSSAAPVSVVLSVIKNEVGASPE